jgi:hypothetical protein
MCGLNAGSLEAVNDAFGAGLRELGLRHVRLRTDELVGLLKAKRPLGALRALHLTGERGSGGLLRALASRPLDELGLSFMDLSDPALCALLADEPLRTHMQDMTLDASSITAPGAAALFAQPWPALRRLSLWTNELGDAGCARLAGLDALEQLVLSGNGVGDAGLARLCDGLPALRSLHLSDNLLTDASIAALVASPVAKQLRVLSLHDNARLTIASLRALLDPERLPALLHLVMHKTAASSDPAVLALVAAVAAERPWVTVLL